jgi:hypothetical protein
MSDLATELLEAADDARKTIEEALNDMFLRFELAMSIAVTKALEPDDERDRRRWYGK